MFFTHLTSSCAPLSSRNWGLVATAWILLGLKLEPQVFSPWWPWASPVTALVLVYSFGRTLWSHRVLEKRRWLLSQSTLEMLWMGRVTPWLPEQQVFPHPHAPAASPVSVSGSESGEAPTTPLPLYCPGGHCSELGQGLVGVGLGVEWEIQKNHKDDNKNHPDIFNSVIISIDIFVNFLFSPFSVLTEIIHFFHILFHYGLLNDVEYDSLCYTLGS